MLSKVRVISDSVHINSRSPSCVVRISHLLHYDCHICMAEGILGFMGFGL
jgi:hypothetical protein